MNTEQPQNPEKIRFAKHQCLGYQYRFDEGLPREGFIVDVLRLAQQPRRGCFDSLRCGYADSFRAIDMALLALRSKLLGLQNPILISLEKMRNTASDYSYVSTFHRSRHPRPRRKSSRDAGRIRAR